MIKKIFIFMFITTQAFASHGSERPYLIEHAPSKESQLTSFTKLLLNGKTVLVALYSGNFDDQGKAQKGSNQNRQYVFGFIQDAKNPTQYKRSPIIGYFNDGGVPHEFIGAAVYKSKLALLSRWDSARAGGHTAMEKVGMNYDVAVFDLTTALDFKADKSEQMKKLSGCDCAVFKLYNNKEPKHLRDEKAPVKTLQDLTKF